MGSKNRGHYTAKQFIEAINGSGGIISTIATRIGCEWNTAQRYIRDYPTIAAAYKNETERVTDMAETALMKAIKTGEAWAVKYFLSTKGKYRGYVERQEVTGADGGAIVVNWDGADTD